MIERIKEFLSEGIVFASMSEIKKTSDTLYKNVKIVPFENKKGISFFQFSFFEQKKVKHENYSFDEAAEKICFLLKNDYNQLVIFTSQNDYHITYFQKLKVKKTPPSKKAQNSQSHNKKKSYILQEGIPVDFLVRLGVMNEQGKVINSRYDKFRQINKYLELIESVIDEEFGKEKLEIVDFGCGKAYLTFALYYYLVKIRNFKVTITGLDIKDDVIDFCSKTAKELGYENLKFKNGFISDYEGTKADMVISLHACDNATDDSIVKAVDCGAKVILAVPCCQHEVNSKLPKEYMKLLTKHGIIKEKLCSLITDSLRAQLLECIGYKTTVCEFIDSEHTPKNILIKAVKTQSTLKSRQKAYEMYKNYKDTLGIDFYLEEKLTKYMHK